MLKTYLFTISFAMCTCIFAEEITLEKLNCKTVATKHGKGLRLEGSVQKFKLTMPLMSHGTLTAWLKAEKYPAGKSLSIVKLTGPNIYIACIYHNASIPMVYMKSGENKQSLSNWSSLPPDKYIHWAVTWQKNKNYLHCWFYLNGVKMSAKKFKVDKAANINTLILGSKDVSGEIAQLKIYNECKTPQDVYQIATGKKYVENLVRNGNFELYNKDKAIYWHFDIWNKPADIPKNKIALFSLDNEIAQNGNLSQQVVSMYNGGKHGWAALFTFVNLEKGRKYNLRFYCKQSGAKEPFLLFLRCNRGGTKPYLKVPFSATKKWTEYSYEFTSPRDDKKAQLIFLNKGQSCIWWIDNVTITEIK